jgi:hypothetical protein
MNTASDKYGSSLDRTLGAGKPVDPATRLSELLAQSLEELTRPFDPPRPGPVPAAEAADSAPHADAPPGEAHGEPASEPAPEHERADADKALAELEAELFAAAKQGIRENADAPARPAAEHSDAVMGQADAHPDGATPAHDGETADKSEPTDGVPPPPLAPEEPPAPDSDAVRVIAKVRKLMLVSMAVTVVAVGSVFGFIGYRMFKGDGTTAKTADKLPEASAIPADMTLAIPRGARVIQSAVAADRLIITLEIDGKIEVRTFDVKTLQPAGRINFSAAP